MDGITHSAERLCWTALGIRMGFTSQARQREEVLAAIDRMIWSPAADHPRYLDGQAVRAVVNAIFPHRRDQLRRAGIAPLPGGRALIGLEDSLGTASYVLELGSEAIYLLTEFARPLTRRRASQVA
jgi:hypothetical protein